MSNWYECILTKHVVVESTGGISVLLNRYAYWHSGEQLLEVISGDSLTFCNEETGFPDYCLEDTMQQLIT